MTSAVSSPQARGIDRQASEDSTTGSALRWTRFLVGLTLILVFAFVAVPQLQRWQPVKALSTAIQHSGVDPTALFYSESDVFCEAEMSVRDSLRYSAPP